MPMKPLKVHDDAAGLGVAPGHMISLNGVGMRFGANIQALTDVDLDLAAGEFVSIVGPSGCGKSTLLRILAGLVLPTDGVAARTRAVRSAFVFQEAALLPWRTVAANAELLMELEADPREERRANAREALAKVGLTGFEGAYPHELSGGMRMRLSLARSIALNPALLLLDEPLAAVDELTRDGLQDELARLWAQGGFAAVLVTHNVQEAVFLSNRVVVMTPRPGRIKAVVDIPLPTPRLPELRETDEFIRLSHAVSHLLRGSEA